MNVHDAGADNNAAAADAPRFHVVIVGGGFGGLSAARSMARIPGVDVTVVDKRNFHLFQPLLYQVATGALSPGDVAAPLREALRKQKNVTVLLGEVTAVDIAGRTIVLGDALADDDVAGVAGGVDRYVHYDCLVVAVGLVNNYFGNDQWETWAPGLKSIEDATEVRSRLLLAFEEAERTSDAAARRALLTFVVVGAGPTGVEMAGAISEIATDTLPIEFRRIAVERARVVLVDAGERVLAAFPEKLSAWARRDLEGMGVEVRTSTFVRVVDADGVIVERAANAARETAPSAGEEPARRERIDTRVVVWAAGVRGTDLAAHLAGETGAELTRQGTIVVGPDLTLANHPEIFVIGDSASFAHGVAHPLPGVAQVAIQQGKFVAGRIDSRLHGHASAETFVYDDRGSMATIGRAKAVADLGFTQLRGFIAWLAWLFVHLLFLVGYENRVLVLTQWAWYYVWRRRSARLITAWQLDERSPTQL